MPHGKKKGRGTNNKKKTKGGNRGNSSSSNNNRNLSGMGQQTAGLSRPLVGGAMNYNNQQNSTAVPSPEQLLQGTQPNYSDFLDQGAAALEEKLPTMYNRYKAGTDRFKTYMKQQWEKMLLQQGQDENKNDNANRKIMSVNSLYATTEWMVETQQSVSPQILKDLKLAIRLRDRVSRDFFGGGDAGHKHFQEALIYCWRKLIHLPKAAVLRGDDNQNTENKNENRFAAFLEDGEEEEMELLDSEQIKGMHGENLISTATPVVRPTVREEEEFLSLDDLLRADDRNDVVLFLLTLNEMMNQSITHYQSVVRQYIQYQSMGASGSAIMEDYLEAAVASNMAIQQVQQLELDLQTQHPHLTTPYRATATLIMPQITQEVLEIVQRHGNGNHSAVSSQQHTRGNLEQEIAMFLGDCLECHCRNPSDPRNCRETIVAEFCSTHSIGDRAGKEKMQEIFSGIGIMTQMELPISMEKSQKRQFQQMLGQRGRLDRWLLNMPFIGGDRSIHHTLRLLQAFGSVIHDTPQDQKIMAKRGFFGTSPWVPGRSRKTQHDLDELLMSDILPQWVMMCRHGILKNKLPQEDELCPLFVLLRGYVQNPSKPVSWSLAFGVHAVLTAILETDQIMEELMQVGKIVFDNYFEQQQWAMQTIATKESDFCQSDVFMNNMFCVAFLNNLGLDVFGARAMWNPLCGGTICSYLCFFGNMEAGCALVDCHAQLRITLHLYHALLTVGIIHEGQIPMMDIIYQCFKSSRAVFEGPPPERGQFVKAFWIAFGMNIADSKKMAESAQQDIERREMGYQVSSYAGNESTWRRRRRMHAVEPAEMSTAFRRICNRDFHDVVDKYHTEEQRQRNQGSDMYLHAVRSNSTLDAIEEDQQLLALHLPSVGSILEQFICSLSRILQWDPILQRGLDGSEYLRDHKRQGLAVLFAQHLLGSLDFAADPLNNEIIPGFPMGMASSHWMVTFFNRIDPGRALWFQPVIVEE